MSDESTAQAKEEQEVKVPPAYGRPINDIIADLSKPIPASMLHSKRQGGNDITFIPWYNATRILDYYAPGWTYEITQVREVGEQQVAIFVRLSIPAAEGIIYREASGIEDDTVKGYGDPTSNAESMALRRAAAKFGLGRYLYQK